MDRRSWPWKKKSSDKTITTTDADGAHLPSSGDTKTDQFWQDDAKSVKYVQITVESYAHLTDMEDQVKILNEKVYKLNEKYSSAQSELTTKDSLVKQHAKVAEEAVSGWEKAEAEALALKQQLESVTLLKLTAEDRASHLDGALKECMKQVRNVKEESEQKLHDVVFAKTKQWEKAKAELEAKIIDSEQELLRSSAEIAALSRTLQERSNLLMKISEERSQAEAEIEVMKSDIESCEREINSLKYELHVVSKELEIRNEEKNMGMRSAEVANKQHLEDVKKITKLEAECQRLRGLVRKKLPGPAALAQMKVEVESLGRDYGETRLRRSPAKTSTPHHTSASDFALESMHQLRKDNEFLTTRLLTMEEEMKMLKEALSKRNSELQVSRNICAKTANKLHNMEAHFLDMNQQKSLSRTDIPLEIERKPPSLTSMSEYGIDDEGSCSEPWATPLISELSQFKKENKNVDKSDQAENPSQLVLMDDFLEMERLATLSTEANGSNAENSIDNSKANLVGVQKDRDRAEEPPAVHPGTLASSNADNPTHELALDEEDLALSTLQSRIARLFESQSRAADIENLLEDIRHIVQDAHEDISQHRIGNGADETHSMKESSVEKENNESTGEVAISGIIKQEVNLVVVEELKNAILKIHDFVLSVGKEATKKVQGTSSDDGGLTERIEEFSASVNKVLRSEDSVDDFLLALSNIFEEKSLLNCIIPRDKCNEGDSYGSDCIDKVTLLENKVAPREHADEKFSKSCMIESHSSSDPEIEGPISLSSELKTTLRACSLEEFEQVKLQKENVEIELARCKEMLELTDHQLAYMEQQLSELKSQLSASEKSNSLAETQLKCMAESYKSLESQKQNLETELNLLSTKAEMLEAELEEEKNGHQDDLAKCNELQIQMERISKHSFPSDAEVDIQTLQEREMASAAEKLAECQESIFLLGKQLNALRPSDSQGSSPNNIHQMSNGLPVDFPNASGFVGGHEMLSPLHYLLDAENINTSTTQRTGNESPFHESHPFPKSPLHPKLQKPRSSRSSSSSSNSLPEKHGRGFSRFFASKGKGEN